MSDEPTPSAMRAALAVADVILFADDATALHLARVIDGETGLPELLAACARTLRYLDACAAPWPGEEGCILDLRAALDKAKGNSDG